MTERIDLNNLDIAVFAAYMVVIVAIGFFAGRQGRRDSKDYFLGDKRLPWYVVGTSMVAPRIASGIVIGTSPSTFSPLRLNTGESDTWVTT